MLNALWVGFFLIAFLIALIKLVFLGHAEVFAALVKALFDSSKTAFEIALPGLHIFEGYCPGEIIPEERGTGGFGYDPIFLLPELGKTMAELSLDEKKRLSHRARAVISALDFLRKLFSEKQDYGS